MSNPVMLNASEISMLFHELARMLRSGFPTVSSLNLLWEGTDPHIKAAVLSMEESVNNGESLSKAIEKSKAFPEYAAAIVRMGEQTGHREDALDSVAKYYKSQDETSRDIKASVVRPIFMIGLILAVLGIILVKVLPIFDDVYASMGGHLTGLAAGALAVGEFLKVFILDFAIILAFIAGVAVATLLIPPLRNGMMNRWKKRHYKKGLTLLMAQSQIAQSMSMCLSSGMTFEQALGFAADTVKNMGPMASHCVEAAKLLQKGWTIKNAFLSEKLLPDKYCNIIDMARQSGSDAEAMREISDELAQEASVKLHARIGCIEPLLVILCAMLIAGILISVMLPLLSIMASMG